MLNEATIERFRPYLKLLASCQMDTYLASQADASDIVQQTLFNAVSRIEQFRGTSERELLGWLRQILANQLIDMVRYHGREKRDIGRERSLEGAMFDSFRRVDALAISNSTPSKRAVQNELLLRLPHALDQLSDAQREAIVLHHLQGLKLAETAERMNKTLSAVCGLLHRGLKRMHELLEE